MVALGPSTAPEWVVVGVVDGTVVDSAGATVTAAATVGALCVDRAGAVDPSLVLGSLRAPAVRCGLAWVDAAWVDDKVEDVDAVRTGVPASTEVWLEVATGIEVTWEGALVSVVGRVMDRGGAANEPVAPMEEAALRGSTGRVAELARVWAPADPRAPEPAPRMAANPARLPTVADLAALPGLEATKGLGGITPTAGCAGIWAGPTVGTEGVRGTVLSRPRGSATAPTPATAARRRNAVTRVADCTVTDIDVVRGPL